MAFTAVRKLFRVIAFLLFCALSGALAFSVAADPAPLTDQELDAVSAKGFSYPSFGYGNIQPTTTTVVPFVPTSASADTDLRNLTIAISNTTNVVTAINQCILSNCADTSADVTASPTTQNQIDIQNNIAPEVHNSTMVPINIGLPHFGGSAGGLAPSYSAPAPSSAGVGSTQWSGPPLPSFGFGGR